MKTIFFAVMAAAFACAGLPASADSLQMHSVAESPDDGANGIPRPERGLTMDEVRARFGNPAEVVGPVGKPQITRWVFGDYTVYFEGNRVIHSVVHRDLRAANQH